MFKISHLRLPNFDFLSLCLFHTENANFTLNLKTTPFPKQHSFSFGVKDKIGILLGFYVRNEQSERKPNFDTPK
jgi:hypothetical protein